MSNYRDYGREERWETNMWMALLTKWWIILLVIGAVIGIIWWTLSVTFSGVKGQGDAQIQKNSAANWTKAQAEFERTYASIKSQDKNITIAWNELQADPKNQVKQTNYSGLVRNCNDTVAFYNSKAREFLAKDFRASDLPSEIDGSDPTTDCKEN